MAKLTAAAAAQILASARQTDAAGMALRIAVKRNDDGSLSYALGFDDVGGEADVSFRSEGVDIVIAPDSAALAKDLVVDYVRLDSGEKAFVFINPHDPNYVPA